MLPEPPRVSLGTAPISLHWNCLLGVCSASFSAPWSPSRAGARPVSSALSPVPSARPPGTAALVLFCRVEPGEVRVPQGHRTLPSPFSPLRNLWCGFSPQPPPLPSPRFWPSPERWGGQREEAGETGRAEQRVRKPPCCRPPAPRERFWQELPAGLRSPWRPGLERVTGSG